VAVFGTVDDFSGVNVKVTVKRVTVKVSVSERVIAADGVVEIGGVNADRECEKVFQVIVIVFVVDTVFSLERVSVCDLEVEEVTSAERLTVAEELFEELGVSVTVAVRGVVGEMLRDRCVAEAVMSLERDNEWVVVTDAE
jgi:hypothetical protein